jgi:hypothetical protein
MSDHTLKDFNLQCALNLHPWTRWKTSEAPATTKQRVQERECPKCGMVQTRTIE